MLLSSERQMHLQTARGEIGRYCILPGDPGRCALIASFLENARLVAQNREFTTYTGSLCGETVSVCSTGIGGPSAAIAVEELFKCGADTFIRVGTCGGIDLSVKAGDIVVATAAVRQEGTSLHYAPPEYPGTAHPDVVAALRMACPSAKAGVVQSKDSFYGQHESERSPVAASLRAKWEAWKALGVLASEMEAAAIFVAAASLRARAGACFLALWNQERAAQGFSEQSVTDTTAAVKCAVDAVRILINGDK